MFGSFPANFTIFLVSYKLENARYDAKVHNFAYRTFKSLKLVLKHPVVPSSYMNNYNMNYYFIIKP